MAKLQNSAVVIRFRFGEGIVKARQRYENTSRAIVSKIAFTYANNTYDRMKENLIRQTEEDVRAELIHMALLFRRHIVGAAGSKSTPSGLLTTVAKGGNQPSQSISSMLPSWAPRNAKYLQRKRAFTGGQAWFDNRDWQSSLAKRSGRRVANTGGKWPSEPGLLFDESRAETWESIFGPISVSFRKSRVLEAGDAQATIKTGPRTSRIQVGTISVRALGNITPAMLPGFSSGNVHASSGGNPGLIGLVRAYNPDLANRLGIQRNGVYRPTLEPFLGFFLTRALPHAVGERINKATLGAINRSS